MNLCKWLMFALLITTSTAQAAMVTSARGVEFMVLDGKKVETDFWQAEQSIELSQGKHQIVMRFDNEVKEGSRKVIYTSRPYIFDLQVDNRDVTLGLNKRIKSQTEAEYYFRKGAKWQASYSNGDVTPLVATELKGSGFAPFSNMEKVVADYNRANGIIFDKGESKDLNELLVEVKDDGKVSIKGDALTQLKLWYSKATNEERKDFRRWMIDQE